MSKLIDSFGSYVSNSNSRDNKRKISLLRSRKPQTISTRNGKTFSKNRDGKKNVIFSTTVMRRDIINPDTPYEHIVDSQRDLNPAK